MSEVVLFGVLGIGVVVWFGYIYFFTELAGNKTLLAFVLSFAGSFLCRGLALKFPQFLDLFTWLQLATAVLAMGLLARLVWFAVTYAKHR